MYNFWFFKLIRLIKKIKIIIAYISNDQITLNFNSIKYSDSKIHISKILKTYRKPTIIDVGAHVGETFFKLIDINKNSSIYSFEPSKNNFKKLEFNTYRNKNIKAYNIGLGHKNEFKYFYENISSPISSFLDFDKNNQLKTLWGINDIKKNKKYKVKIFKFDTWIKDKKIKTIELFKIDTQGFELNVLKGAKESLNKKIIKNIIVEIIFIKVYEKQPKFNEINNLLNDYNYELKAIIDQSYNKNGELLQADFLYKPKI